MSKLYIKGSVQAIYFENPSNFYKVILVSIDDTNTRYTESDIVITGTLGQIQLESSYTFFGQLIEHAKYGQQFQVVHSQQEALSSEKGLIHYLSSDKFPGIGSTLATRIVDMFGEDTITKIIQNVPELSSVKGLTTQKRQLLVETLTSLQSEHQTILTLLTFGLTEMLAYHIFQLYRDKSIQVIEQNPYSLLESIEGIGFTKLDQIGEQLNFEPHAQERLFGALYTTLRDLCYTTGHTYLQPMTLLKQTILLLEKNRPVLIDEQTLTNELVNMIHVGKIIEDNHRLALPSIYYAENGIVSALNRLLNQEDITYPKIDLMTEIDVLEQTLSIQYSQKQREAIIKAITSPLSILTGGPGTGKTTVLNGIVYLFATLNNISLNQPGHTLDKAFPILLAAPTGRAAKRMKELTGLPAMTLHRLLGIGLTGESLEPSDTFVQSLDGMFLIIDEMSMVDTWLMNWVLTAIPMGMQVVLVGDKHQLPSVGPGQVLHDLLMTNKIPSTELTQVYRQDESSTIISLAHHIKDGQLPTDFTQNFPDRSFFACSATQVPIIIEKVVTRAKERGYSIKDIQVLAPMYKGVAGITQLNTMIQNILNPATSKRRQVDYFDKVYRIGDKVLQLVNQPEQNVFNGDIGEIVGIFFSDETEDKVDTLLVSFDGVEVVYKRHEWNNLTLAYCCSIHKSQGSEFPLVILPMVQQYGRMLRRDLLYTALTRSKQLLVLCGEETAFHEATVKDVLYRQTLLAEKLNNDVSPSIQEHANNGKTDNIEHVAHDKDKQTTMTTSKQYQLTETNYLTIDAMIGMDNISPFDFMPSDS